MQQEEIEYMNELEEELRRVQSQARNLAKSQLNMMQIGNSEDNLVKWQLNLEEEKERIYYLLKGYRQVYDEKTDKRIWIEPETKESQILNDYGIDYIMGLLESFLNRNIILSNFKEDRINEICLDLSKQLIRDIFNDYEHMGLDTNDKRKKASMIVWKVVINVEAALRRAMDNGERRSLRQIMTVTQTDSGQRMPEYPMVQQKRKLWNPRTW